MNNQLSICICILFFEKAGQTIECVQSFLPSGVPIYILNNNSSQESTQTLKEFCKDHPQVTIFDSPENLGVSGGRNYLIKSTKEEWMLFVDNDIVVDTKDWLSRLKQHMTNNQDIEVFIPKLFNVHENSYCKFQSFRIEGKKVIRTGTFLTRRLNAFPGGASVIRRTLFDRLGMYDEEMFVGFEDFELCVRGLKSEEPVKALLIKDILLVHDHRVAHNPEDKRSVFIRYDVEKHKKSNDQLTRKHDLVMQEDWQEWLENQVKKQAHGVAIRKKPLVVRVHNKLTRTVSSIINNKK